MLRVLALARAAKLSELLLHISRRESFLSTPIWPGKVVILIDAILLHVSRWEKFLSTLIRLGKAVICYVEGFVAHRTSHIFKTP